MVSLDCVFSLEQEMLFLIGLCLTKKIHESQPDDQSVKVSFNNYAGCALL